MYVVYMYDNYKKIKLTPRTTIYKACYELSERLKALNCSNIADTGSFISTKNPITKEITTKRYVVNVFLPKVKLEIHKITKGDINEEELLEIIRRLNERI